MAAATNLSEKVRATHPLATNFAGHFYDTLDYFMYNKRSVQVQEVL
jgi:mRNA deadenylase 3'-5' endonuclease subunit Ccr4